MIEVKIGPEQIARAEKLYKFGNLKDSITKGENQIYGALGEVLVMDHYANLNPENVGARDYDIKLKGYNIEVKTKKVNKVPKQFINATVAKSNDRQRCDFYFFVQVSADLSRGVLLGYISRAEFFERATFNKKGEAEGPTFKFRADCWNLKISQLKKIKNK